MPRTARKKFNEAFYHIMSRSISEINLFQSDEDKSYYLTLLKKYTLMHQCSIYAYCLMDNHVHLFINPQGFDISKFMHCLNNAYVSYFNRRYQRRGHLFQGRFASTIVTNDAYGLTLAAYIHNNPKIYEKYRGREEDYPYSSYGIYVGKRQDVEGIVDKNYILKLFSVDPKNAVKKCYYFTKMMTNSGIMTELDSEISNAYTENAYRSEKRVVERTFNPEMIIEKICKLIGEESPENIKVKYNREKTALRALAVYAMRVFCGYTFKRISHYLGDMSLSGVIKLAKEGFKLSSEKGLYQNIFTTLKLTKIT